MLVSQSCSTLCDPMDCSPPDFSVHEIFQARILEWVAISFSRGSPNPGIKPGSPALQADSFTNWATREALYKYRASLLSTVSRRVGNDWETLTYSSANIFLNFWVLGNLTKKGVNNILLLDFLTVVFEKKNRRTGSTHLATLAAAEKELAEKEA